MHNCRLCGAGLTRTFVDLGTSPLSNAYLEPAQLEGPETHWPLRVYVCEACLLVQLPAFEAPEAIFGDYAYFSSFSDSWLAHAKAYAEAMTRGLNLGKDSLVVEAASNDGYLLRHFQALGVGVLGIEPAANVAKAAVALGIPTRVAFLGAAEAEKMRADGVHADLVAGNNVLAHVPDLHDFVAGLALLLKPEGTLTLEFPHLLRLIEGRQFDTIYHEHFSYFSLATAEAALARHGLAVHDVEELGTHGGSLRLFAAHQGAGRKSTDRLEALRQLERSAGLDRLGGHLGFAAKVQEVKAGLLDFLLRTKREGKIVAGYGAPAKGNTLLNYCGIREDLLPFTVDRNPHKQGRFLPGSRIPIRPVEAIRETKPDYLLILPWNLREEIEGQMAQVRDWGGRFVVAVPELEIR